MLMSQRELVSTTQPQPEPHHRTKQHNWEHAEHIALPTSSKTRRNLNALNLVFPSIFFFFASNLKKTQQHFIKVSDVESVLM